MQGSNISTAVRIGCSGWAYKHWRGLFYPDGLPQRLWFNRYADEFDTVEINASFYHLPKPETFEKWRDQAPPGFCYSVKANRFITQAKKLLDCEEPLEGMISATRHLGDRLGPMLYQLPPSLKIDFERLERFLELLPKDVTSVFEFRDPSWYDEHVLALLDGHGCGFVAHDMRGRVSPRWASGTTAYIRFHGHGGKYWGRYPEEVLSGWAKWACEQLSQGRSAWCYFNNDIHGHAIEDARTLKRMVQEKGR